MMTSPSTHTDPENGTARPTQFLHYDHSFYSDYRPGHYTNLTKSTLKTRISTQFVVPKPGPTDSILSFTSIRGLHWSYNHAAARRAKWMPLFLQQESHNQQDTELDSSDPELSIIVQRVQELVAIAPVDFLSLIYNIRYQVDQKQHRRQKLQDALLAEGEEFEKKIQERRHAKRGKESSHYNKSSQKFWKRFVKRPLHLAGFGYAISASSIHFCSCFHIGAMAFVLMLQEEYTHNRQLEAILANRIFMMVGLAFIFVGCITGLVGHYWRKRNVIFTYLFVFYVGWIIAVIAYFSERNYALGDWVKMSLKSQVKEFIRNPKADIGFLKVAQSKFRCCGYRGVKDYGGVVLPKSCCDFQECRPALAYSRGCTKPVKTLLRHLFDTKVLVFPFLIVSFFMTIFSVLNLLRHYRTTENNVVHTKPYKQWPSIEPNLGQLFLEAVEKATTVVNTDDDELDKGDIPRSIEAVRRKLADCENITDFIPTVVQLLYEVDALREDEKMGADWNRKGPPDPEVVARVILGLRPRRFVSEYLLEDDFEELLQHVRFDENLRTELLQRELLFCLDMQEAPPTTREEIERRDEILRQYNIMRFPLPRPFLGLRHSKWEKVKDNNYLAREDVYFLQQGPGLDPSESEYLEQDRVLHLAHQKEKVSCFTKFCHKLFPSLGEMKEEEYTFLEDGLYAPSVEILSKIITESQGILRDLHRRTRFQLNPESKEEPNSDPSKASFLNLKQLDIEQVNVVLKKICHLEAIKEQRFNAWVYEQEHKEHV